MRCDRAVETARGTAVRRLAPARALRGAAPSRHRLLRTPARVLRSCTRRRCRTARRSELLEERTELTPGAACLVREAERSWEIPGGEGCQSVGRCSRCEHMQQLRRAKLGGSAPVGPPDHDAKARHHGLLGRGHHGPRHLDLDFSSVREQEPGDSPRDGLPARGGGQIGAERVIWGGHSSSVPLMRQCVSRDL